MESPVCDNQSRKIVGEACGELVFKGGATKAQVQKLSGTLIAGWCNPCFVGWTRIGFICSTQFAYALGTCNAVLMMPWVCWHCAFGIYYMYRSNILSSWEGIEHCIGLPHAHMHKHTMLSMFHIRHMHMHMHTVDVHVSWHGCKYVARSIGWRW